MRALRLDGCDAGADGDVGGQVELDGVDGVGGLEGGQGLQGGRGGVSVGEDARAQEEGDVLLGGEEALGDFLPVCLLAWRWVDVGPNRKGRRA